MFIEGTAQLKVEEYSLLCTTLSALLKLTKKVREQNTSGSKLYSLDNNTYTSVLVTGPM